MATDVGDAFSPRFYVNNATWNCHYNNESISTDFVNVKPGVCAYVPAVSNSVWLCQAPDASCWTWNHACTGEGNRPGLDQIGCNANGVSWCCLDFWEVCSGTENQTNVCWANTFSNPLLAIDPDSPNATIEAGTVLEYLGIPTVPVPSGNTFVVTATDGASSTTDVSDTANATNEACPTPPDVTKMLNNSRTRGAVVGQIIGSLVAAGLLMNAVLWILRIRHRRKLKRKILEPSTEDVLAAHRVSNPLPASTGLRRSSSRVGLRERSNSHTRTDSSASHRYQSHEFDFGTDSRNTSQQSILRQEKEIFAASSSPPTDNITPAPLSPKAPNPVYRVRSPPLSTSALPQRTNKGSGQFRNIAEAYDDAPEDPADLDGYVTFEAGRRGAERTRLAKKQQQRRWVD